MPAAGNPLNATSPNPSPTAGPKFGSLTGGGGRAIRCHPPNRPELPAQAGDGPKHLLGVAVFVVIVKVVRHFPFPLLASLGNDGILLLCDCVVKVGSSGKYVVFGRS